MDCYGCIQNITQSTITLHATYKHAETCTSVVINYTISAILPQLQPLKSTPTSKH